MGMHRKNRFSDFYPFPDDFFRSIHPPSLARSGLPVRDAQTAGFLFLGGFAMDDEAPDVATCADSDAVIEALFESAAVDNAENLI